MPTRFLRLAVIAVIVTVALCRASAALADPALTEIVVKVKAPPDRPALAIRRAVVEETRRVLVKRLPPQVEIVWGKNDSKTLVLRVPADVSVEQVEMLLRMRGILDFREAVTGGGWRVVMGDFLITEAMYQEPPKTQAFTPMVRVKLTTEGGRQFSIVTARLMGRPLGIFLDDKMLSCPIVQTPIRGGVFDITGFMSPDEARTIAAVLNSGPLGVALKVVRKAPAP